MLKIFENDTKLCLKRSFEKLNEDKNENNTINSNIQYTTFINQTDEKLNTMLHRACIVNNTNLSNKLLLCNANANIQNES